MSNKSFGTALLTVAMAVGTASPTLAQDSLQTGQRPEVHVVQLGETLWGLAHMYLGDPFLWPEIYRLNEAVIEDPHWIFPGEELRLAAPDRTAVAVTAPAEAPPVEAPPPAVAAAPPTETPTVTPPPVETPMPTPAPPPIEGGRTVFAPRARTATTGPSLDLALTDAYRAVVPGDFYAAGFLTEGEDFPWAEVLGNADPGAIHGMPGNTANLMQTVRIRAPEGANYQVGDTLVTYVLRRQLTGGWGRIVQPTSLMQVMYVSGREVLAQVMAQFDEVRQGQVALPVEPFKNPGRARAQPVADGVEGSVITLRTPYPVPKQFDVAFIDLGRNAGIVPGDVFEVLPRRGGGLVSAGTPPDPLADLKVVHVRERSATVVLSRIFTLGIGTTGADASGLPVRLVRKMPS
jgi:hypothetical protein